MYWRKGCQPKGIGKATVFSIFEFDPTNSSTTRKYERLGALSAHSVKPKPVKSAPAKPKYQKGENAWSGRGTQPAWLKQHRALGGTLLFSSTLEMTTNPPGLKLSQITPCGEGGLGR
jgi:hypothetical protein